jgi:hypothetical protein
MKDQNLTHSIVVDQSPAQVFAAINDVCGWWSQQITGPTDAVGGVFEFRYKDVHRTTHRISELVPERKVVWHVVTSELNFVTDKTEWNGTDIVFEIKPRGTQTELTFTHIGLRPAAECYEQCSKAWGFYIRESLRDLIMTGKGRPNQKDSSGEPSAPRAR